MADNIDVMAIGNAIVDILSFVDTTFLHHFNLQSGTMGLIDEAVAETLVHNVNPVMTCAGGSAANAMAGIASLGGKSAFVGRVKEDSLGDEFQRSLSRLGVSFRSVPSQTGPGTANSLIFITPDAERTMRTFLGASVNITPADLERSHVERAKILMLETYLFEPKLAFETNLQGAIRAHAAGNRVALATSDVTCVQSYRTRLLDFIPQHVDILITNQAEAMALTLAPTKETAFQALRHLCPLTVMTCGSQGSYIAQGEEVLFFGPPEVETIVDLTGAGDLYAGGFLWALTQNMCLSKCGKVATIAAGEVISHIGARPRSPLSSIMGQIW